MENPDRPVAPVTANLCYTPIAKLQISNHQVLWPVYTAYPYSPSSTTQCNDLIAAITPLIPSTDSWYHVNPFTEPAVPDIEAARATWNAHFGYVMEYIRSFSNLSDETVPRRFCILVLRERIVLVDYLQKGEQCLELAWNFGVAPRGPMGWGHNCVGYRGLPSRPQVQQVQQIQEHRAAVQIKSEPAEYVSPYP